MRNARSGHGEAARKAAASKIMRAIGTEVTYKQAYITYMMATLVQELRNEEQFMADFAQAGWCAVVH